MAYIPTDEYLGKLSGEITPFRHDNITDDTVTLLITGCRNLKARIAELEIILKRRGAEILRLTELRENQVCELEADVARKDAALEAAESGIIPAINYLTASAKCRPKEKRARAEKGLADKLSDARALIREALKGEPK